MTPDSPHIRDLYHQILPTRDAVYPAAKALADELAASTSQVSIAFAKGLLQHPGDSIEENHLLDSKAIKATAGSKDAAEGVKAFFEKRTPKYTGVLSNDLPHWVPWVSHATPSSTIQNLSFAYSGADWTSSISNPNYNVFMRIIQTILCCRCIIHNLCAKVSNNFSLVSCQHLPPIRVQGADDFCLLPSSLCGISYRSKGIMD